MTSYSFPLIGTILLCTCAFIIQQKSSGNSQKTEEFVFKISKPEENIKYLALVGNKQQLGNQIWSLVSGYSIAKKLNRNFYVSQNWHDPELLSFKLADVHKIFPKFSETYKILAPKGEALAPHNYYNGKMNNTHYEDPLKHKNREEKFLVLDTPYAQNALYFYEYLDEIRELFEFSLAVRQEGDEIIAQKRLPENNIVCAHIRRRDFSMYNWQSEFSPSLGVIEKVLREDSTLIMFGDDIEFMDSIVDHLKEQAKISKQSFSSSNSKGVDLYLASKLCSSMVLTTQSSSYSFWLAFLSKNQDAVYYLYDAFDPSNPYKPRFDKHFPFPWKSIKI